MSGHTPLGSGVALCSICWLDRLRYWLRVRRDPFCCPRCLGYGQLSIGSREAECRACDGTGFREEGKR